jgi:hypothetical protein
MLDGESNSRNPLSSIHCMAFFMDICTPRRETCKVMRSLQIGSFPRVLKTTAIAEMEFE